MKTVRHHLRAQLRRGLQGHFGRVWEGFERLLIRNKDLLFPGVRNRPSVSIRSQNPFRAPLKGLLRTRGRKTKTLKALPKHYVTKRIRALAHEPEPKGLWFMTLWDKRFWPKPFALKGLIGFLGNVFWGLFRFGNSRSLFLRLVG